MDSYEATRIVFSKIQTLDPENASKIMGYLLLQDHGEKEMIRLAFGPESQIQSLILKAKTHLGLSNSNPPTPSTPSSPSPFSSKPSPLSIPSYHHPISPSSNSNISYASIVNGSSNTCNDNEFVDDYQFQDNLSFLNDSGPDSAMSAHDSILHRRSFSVPGLYFQNTEDVNSPGIGWKPCLYFQRGFCKNGTTCRFVHGGDYVDGGAALVGSPSKFSELEQYQELLRSKALQQQKLASGSQFMSMGSFPYSKSLNLLLQQQNDTHRSAMASLMMGGDEVHKFGRSRSERNVFSAMGLGAIVNPVSRQIYLTFPADSSFKEEDVSNYFSTYGPVQDVRIPYQQKRMFGFVTFVYPETVKLILAKGNPHFVCDSRVLVKPYKEKGKVQEKKQQQQLERGEYSACSSPSAVDSREPFDLHLGSRMFYNTQEMLLRRKLEEQADLQQAIELQGRRLMNLQMLDLKNHHLSQFHHGLSTGSPVPSPTVSCTPNNQALVFPVDGIDQEVLEENGGCRPVSAGSELAAAVNDDKTIAVCNHKTDNSNSNTEESDLPEGFEHILPDNLFASPKKSAGDHLTYFSTSSAEADDKSGTPTAPCTNGNPSLANASSLNMASLNTYLLQMPRFSSGQGTIGM